MKIDYKKREPIVRQEPILVSILAGISWLIFTVAMCGILLAISTLI
jgi:hypothetical protein